METLADESFKIKVEHLLKKFNFEEELLNQAKVMEAHRRSSDTGKLIHLEELN